MKKITAYTWAFIVLLIAFFMTGMFTLGDCASRGDALTLKAKTAATYSFGKSVNVDSVYVNVGCVYEEIGTDVTLTVKTSSSNNMPTSSSGWTTYGSPVTVANVYGTEGLEGNNYNWIKVGSGLNKSAKWLSVTATKALQINEIVCLDAAGVAVSMKVGSASDYTRTELAAAIDAPEALNVIVNEETGAYSISNEAYYNLAQEESYYMASIQNVLDGKTYIPDVVYTLDGSYNYLATLLMAPSVALFGANAFAIRLPAFIATCAMLTFAFLLVKNMLKSDKYGFLFAVVFAIAGLATSIGRFGAPYAMVASALVASLYFMHRFFSKGIGSKKMVKGGLPVLFSGIFAAIAMAMDITACIPVVGVLVLFGFGLRRQKIAYKLALAKTEGKEEEAITEDGEKIVVNVAAEKATTEYKQKTRISYGFAALSFVVLTLILILLASVLCYSAYVKASGNSEVNFLTVVWQGVKGSFRSNVLSTYDATNKANVFAWFIPFRPATVYTGVTAVGSGEYLAWSIMPNAVVTVGAAVAFLGCTAKLIIDFVTKANSKKALRFRRMYFILLGGMAAAMAAAAVRGNVSAMSGMLFQVFYVAFLPMLATLLPEGETTGEKALINVVIWTVICVFAVSFIISIPAFYGAVVPASEAKLFNWMSIRSNKWFRVSK